MNVSDFNKYSGHFIFRVIIGSFGFAAAFITIYTFLQEKEVDLRYEIIANANVLDFNADINKLEVLYDSTSLKKTGKNLRVYTIKVINNGEKNIIKEFYDENEPVGIRVDSGQVIEQPEIIRSSNGYLKRNVKFLKREKGDILFSNVIIESGEFFIIKLLVLHDNNIDPKIKAFGKVAGQKNINVVNSVDFKGKVTFLKKVYYGGFWVQFLRLVSYSVMVILSVAISFLISEKIDFFRYEKGRKKNLKEFKALKTVEYSRKDNVIFERYLDDELDELKTMSMLINNDKKLNKICGRSLEDIEREVNKKRRVEEGLSEYDLYIINEMLDDGIIFKEHDRLKVNESMKDSLDKFLSFLMDKKGFIR